MSNQREDDKNTRFIDGICIYVARALSKFWSLSTAFALYYSLQHKTTEIETLNITYLLHSAVITFEVMVDKL
jgi:hypothetical protein